MNWTEGNLARHSRGRQRNELLTRQKQHFAKVRNNLLRGSKKQSPVSISFFGTQHSRSLGRRVNSRDIPSRAPSSPLLVEKRKRAQGSQEGLHGQSSTHEKRRRLLEKTDWVGLDLQQPIDITFPGQVQASTGSRWSRVDRPRAHTIRAHRELLDVAQFDATPEAHHRPMKIQIGSQEIYPSVSTASQPSTRRYSLAPQPLANSSQKRVNPISSPEPSHARHLYVTSGSSQSSQIPKDNRHGTTRERGTSDFRMPLQLLKPEKPAHVVYSSSVILEPIPRRANDFTVLEWSPSSSEDRGSMKVEIERPSRPVPPSEKVDQNRWKDLVLNPSDNAPDDPTISPQIGDTLSVSSHTSTLPSHLQRRLPSYDVSSEPSINGSHRYSEPSANDEDDIPQIIQAAVNKDVHQEAEEKAGTGNRPREVQKEAQPVDDNSAWMKFVFDGDSEELEAQVFAEAARQVAAELQPSETSTDLVDTTGTAATCGTDPLVSDEKEQSDSLDPETSSESHMATRGTTASESVVSNVATVGSTIETEPESRFRFAAPRTFVGKLANSGVTAHRLPVISHRGEKKRGRPKKKARDGRTDIRRLPDFDGDPIEEFEEDQ